MSEYLAPGVYVEETSFRSKSIEGVSTTTTGFVGPTRFGPILGQPELLTSVGQFERLYGDSNQLWFAGSALHNYTWHGVRNFFEEGGKRLYVARAFKPLQSADGASETAEYTKPTSDITDDEARPINDSYPLDGHARRWITAGTVAIAAVSHAEAQLRAALATVITELVHAQNAVAAAEAAFKRDATSAEAKAAAEAAEKAVGKATSAVTLAEEALTHTTDRAGEVPVPGNTTLAKTELTAVADGVEALGAATDAAATAAVPATQASNNQALADAATALKAKQDELAEARDEAAAAKTEADRLRAAATQAASAADDAQETADTSEQAAVDAQQAADDAAAAAGGTRDTALDLAAASARGTADADAASAAQLQAAVQPAEDAATAAETEQSEAEGEVTTLEDELTDAEEALETASGATTSAKVAEALEAARSASDGLGAVTASLHDAALAAATAAATSFGAGGVTRDDAVLLRARFPGAFGNLRVRFTLRFSANVLSGSSGRAAVRSLLENDVVWISQGTAAAGTTPAEPNPDGSLYIATRDPVEKTWRFGASKQKDDTTDLRLNLPPGLNRPALAPENEDAVRIATLSVSVFMADGLPRAWDGLALDPAHTRDGAVDAFSQRFAVEPSNRDSALSLPFEVLLGREITTGLQLFQMLFGHSDLELAALGNELVVEHDLIGGNDGQRPGASEYQGSYDDQTRISTGLRALEDLEDISIVAAPGSTFGLENGYAADARSIIGQLISHAENMQYRIAVLDSGNGQSLSQVRALRARLDSKYAALYYPWVQVLDPVTRQEIFLPPSGFIAGIYARNDIRRAVWKAPANEVVNGALGFELLLNKAQQDVLNPDGINCLRFFEGRGFRVWGARTISSDPEWKYVNLRRYFIYLERSIDRATQWAVFEPNGEALWDNVRRSIEDFLFNEWQNGALLGDRPEKAYVVRCDRSTMSQNDLDNGRLVCKVGVAALRPAEYVIFRIGQWTADRKI